MNSYVCAFFLLIVLGCTKPDNATPANQLVGTWRLITYCKPVNSSACTSVTVPSDKNVWITFTNDGTFNEAYDNTKPIEYSFLGCGGGSYKIEGTGVRIRALCMSSSYGQLMQLVSVEANRLVLNPFSTGEYVFIR